MSASNAATPEEADLFTKLYSDLSKIAHAELSRYRRSPELTTTALVHETYLKMSRGKAMSFENRKHFFATAAKVMRQLVVDHARSRLAACRKSPDAEPLSLSDFGCVDALAMNAEAENLLALDRAFSDLAKVDARAAQIIELRFFAGLEVVEIADILGVSEKTVQRDCKFAEAFVKRHVSD